MSELDKIKEQAVEQLGEPTAAVKYTYTYAELHKLKNVKQEFLVPGLIPYGAMAVMIGVDGVGKTQITSQLGFCVGTKRDSFIGLQLNVKTGETIIAATEDAVEKFAGSIGKIGDGLDPNHDPEKVGLRFVEASEFPDLPAFIAELDRLLKDKNADLVVVDAFQDLLLLIDGEINSNSNCNKAMSPFQGLCKKYGCAIIFIHHASKTSAKEKQAKNKFFLEKNDSQGAGRITQKPRTVLGLTHDFASSAVEDSHTYTNYLHVLKTNIAGREYMKNAISLTFDQNTLLHESTGLVNIENFETADRTANDFTPEKKAMPKQIDFAEHRAKVDVIFENKDSLSRKDLVEAMRGVYAVGKNKIEQAGGYLSFLIEHGLIQGNVGVFRKGDENEFKMPISSEDWDSTTQVEKPLDINPKDQLPDDLDTPF